MTARHQGTQPDVNGGPARPAPGDGSQAAAAVHRRRHPRHRRLRADRPGRRRGRGAAWAPFLVAFVVATITAFSYLELVTKYPQAAGAALYTHKAFGMHFFTFLVALHRDVLRDHVGVDRVAARSPRTSPTTASGSTSGGGVGITLIALGFMLLVAAGQLPRRRRERQGQHRAHPGRAVRPAARHLRRLCALIAGQGGLLADRGLRLARATRARSSR